MQKKKKENKMQKQCEFIKLCSGDEADLTGRRLCGEEECVHKFSRTEQEICADSQFTCSRGRGQREHPAK